MVRTGGASACKGLGSPAFAANRRRPVATSRCPLTPSHLHSTHLRSTRLPSQILAHCRLERRYVDELKATLRFASRCRHIHVRAGRTQSATADTATILSPPSDAAVDGAQSVIHTGNPPNSTHASSSVERARAEFAAEQEVRQAEAAVAPPMNPTAMPFPALPPQPAAAAALQTRPHQASQHTSVGEGERTKLHPAPEDWQVDTATAAAVAVAAASGDISASASQYGAQASMLPYAEEVVRRLGAHPIMRLSLARAYHDIGALQRSVPLPSPASH